MNMVYKQFMGLKTPVKSDSDRLLEASFKEIYKVLTEFLSPVSVNSASNIYDFISECKRSKPTYHYFWNWMEEQGFSLLNQLDRRLPNTEEVLDFLAYRKMILEMDAMNDSIDMFFLSITEFLVSASEFLSTYFETAAGTQEFPHKEHIQLPAEEVSFTTTSHWESIQSSAPFGAELLLYL